MGSGKSSLASIKLSLDYASRGVEKSLWHFALRGRVSKLMDAAKNT